MEAFLWMIDKQPSSSFEDGEISEDENDQSKQQCKTIGDSIENDTKNLNFKLNNSTVHSNDDGLLEISSNVNLDGNLSSTNDNLNTSTKSNQDNSTTNKQANNQSASSKINTNDNKSNPNKINNNKFGGKSKKNILKKGPRFDYSNLSEAELDEKFKQVYYQIQRIESNGNQPNQPWSNMQPISNQQFNQPQIDYSQQFNQPQPNHPQQFNQSFTINRPNHGQLAPPKKQFNNQKSNKFNNPFQQFDQQMLNPKDLMKLKRMFQEMTKIVMKNCKSKNKFGANQRNGGQINIGKNEKKRRLRDKNSSNKRLNAGVQLVNSQQNQVFNQQKQQQQQNNNPANPVITSDLFSPPIPMNKQTKNRRTKSSNGNQICKYFFAGSCHKGNKCEFLHTKDKSKKIKELCKFYIHGACDKGLNCVYMHKEFPCKFFHTGAKCYDNENCKFSHEPLTEEMSLVLKQFLNPKEKNVDSNEKKDKVLLGQVSQEMRSSHDTWQWQQELLDRATKLTKHTGEEENFFKISTEFLIKNEPSINDPKFNGRFYLENDPTNQKTDQQNELQNNVKIKRENVELNVENDQPQMNNCQNGNQINAKVNNQIKSDSLIQNQLSSDLKENFYLRRENLVNIKPNNDRQKNKLSYEEKIKGIIRKSKLDKLFANKTTSNETCPSSNANLYRPSELMDNFFGTTSSLIDKLAQETKVSDLAQQSNDTLMDQFSQFKNNLITKSLSSTKIASTITSNQDKNTSPNINMTETRSLIDEIMSSKGYVGSSITSSKPVKSLNFNQPIDQFSSLNSANHLHSTKAYNIAVSGYNDYNGINFVSESDLFNSSNSAHSIIHSNDLQLNMINQDLNLTDLNMSNLLLNGVQSRMSNSKFSINQHKSTKEPFVVSRSDDGALEFKLYLIDKVESNYYQYKQFYFFDQDAQNDIRLIKKFDPEKYTNSMKTSNIIEKLNSIKTEREIEDDDQNLGLSEITGLSNLRKKSKANLQEKEIN